MNDPKLEGTPILRKTGCTVGSHVFIYTVSGPGGWIPNDLPCGCGAYTYVEWSTQLWMEHAAAAHAPGDGGAE